MTDRHTSRLRSLTCVMLPSSRRACHVASARRPARDELVDFLLEVLRDFFREIASADRGRSSRSIQLHLVTGASTSRMPSSMRSKCETSSSR